MKFQMILFGIANFLFGNNRRFVKGLGGATTGTVYRAVAMSQSKPTDEHLQKAHHLQLCVIE